MTQYDVFSYGVISTSRLILIAGDFPKADLYAEMVDQYKMTGGEAANSSIALSRLGMKVKLDGNWLGDNVDERHTIDLLRQYDIDTHRLTLKDNFSGPNEIVVADKNTRTIFGNYGHTFGSVANWNDVHEEDIQNAKVVCLDPFFRAASEQVAVYCMKHKKPYVTLDCPYDSDIAKNAEVIIIAGEYRSHHYSNWDVEDLFEAYKRHCKGLIIFTFGSEKLYYGRNDGKKNTFKPFDVQAVDTAGAGDSFRSGIIYGMIKGATDLEMIEYGAAVSALVCSRFPGVLNAPDLDEVEAFLAQCSQQA